MPMLSELDMLEARGLPRCIRPVEIAESSGATSQRDNKTAGVVSFWGGSVAMQAPRPQIPLASKINHKARGLQVANLLCLGKYQWQRPGDVQSAHPPDAHKSPF